MMREPTISLEIAFYWPDEEGLPSAVYSALEPYISSNPTSMRLLWPIPYIPRAGEEIVFSDVKIDLHVSKVEYWPDYRGFSRVYIKTDGVHDLGIETLVALAEAGFASDDGRPLRDILKEAGFPSNLAGYHEMKSKERS